MPFFLWCEERGERPTSFQKPPRKLGRLLDSVGTKTVRSTAISQILAHVNIRKDKEGTKPCHTEFSHSPQNARAISIDFKGAPRKKSRHDQVLDVLFPGSKRRKPLLGVAFFYAGERTEKGALFARDLTLLQQRRASRERPRRWRRRNRYRWCRGRGTRRGGRLQRRGCRQRHHRCRHRR